MLSPDNINSFDMSRDPSPISPAERSTNSTVNTNIVTPQSKVYEPTKRPGEVNRDVAIEEFAKLFRILDEEKEQENLLETISKELIEDKKLAEEKAEELEKLKEEHKTNLYWHVKSRDKERARLIKALSAPQDGVFEFGNSTDIDFSAYIASQNESRVLQKNEVEIRSKDTELVGMRKNVTEKEERKKELETQISGMHAEYDRIHQLAFAASSRRRKSPVCNEADQNPPSSIPSGSNSGQKRTRTDTSSGSGSIAPKKTKKAVDDNIPQSLPSTSGTSTPKPPTAHGPSNKK